MPRQRLTKPKTDAKNVANAIHVLNQLKRRIDCEARDAIKHGGEWFLHSERVAIITNVGARNLEAIDQVISCLVQWRAVLDVTSTPHQPQNSDQQGRAK